MSDRQCLNDPDRLDDGDEQSDKLSSSMASGDANTDADEDNFADSDEKPPMGRAMVLIAVITLAGAGLLSLMCLQSSATAAPESPDIAAASQTVTQFLSDGPRRWAAIQQTFTDTESLVRQVQKDSTATQVSLSQLTTNPFQYARRKLTTDIDEIADRQKKEQQRLSALQAVQGLHLQSVVSNSTRRACMIDGSFFTEGQTAEGFLVERIDNNSIILRQGDSRFQIRTQN